LIQTRQILKYYAVKGLCHLGYTLILEVSYYSYVNVFKDFSESHKQSIIQLSKDNPLLTPQAVFEKIDGFVALFEKNRYAHTATVGARHVMTALYLFLDMNEFNYCPDIAYIWYNEIIPITGVCYRTWRRIVILFGYYTHEGDICASSCRELLTICL